MQSLLSWLLYLAITQVFSENQLYETIKNNFQIEANDENQLKLPSAVIPFDQLVRLQPYYNNSKVTRGYTEISFRIEEATSSITFHTAGLTIDQSSVQIINEDNLKHVPITGLNYSNDTQMVTLHLGSEGLRHGHIYIMDINFTAPLNDHLFGLYESFYIDQDGEEVNFAVTQFAAIYARWSFPCFDEPDMKVTFKIQIESPSNLTAISNMPVMSSELVLDDPSWRLDTFEVSPIMSSYLVAFIVADFVNMSVVVDNVTFGVWATRSGIIQAKYALSIAPDVIKYYDDSFGISYSSMMPKIDMAAVPDFFYGAMENWGLIIYRESTMLYDSKLSSALDKQRVCETIAHELAHMWFGNLVTFKWWNDVWLNEGFARFLQFWGCDAVEPTFGMPDQILIQSVYKAFGVDSLASAKPLSPNITELDQIYGVYNTMAYDKGAAVIRMMEYFLTPPTFQMALRNYLETYSYSNAQHSDLWTALNNQGHADGTLDPNLSMMEIMSQWTIHPGYPVLNVAKYDNGTIFLTQKRFLEKSNSTLEDVRWFIPLTYVTQGDPDFTQTQVVHWMMDQNMILPEDSRIQSDQWIIFNVQQNGYYRVNYDETNWNKLIKQFHDNYTLINSLNRAQILDDGYSFARTGALKYDTILSINAYLSNEDNYVPMKTALDRLSYLYTMLLRSSANSAFKDYMSSLVIPIYNNYGFDDSLADPHSVQLKRALVVDWACKLQYSDCTNSATNIYNEWMTNPSNNSVISPNLRSTVYCTAIAEGADLQWDFAYERYVTSSIANQRSSLIYGMGCTSDESLINRYMNLAIVASSGIKKQDVNDVFRSLAENIYGRDLAWKFIQNNTDKIALYMGSYQSVVVLTDIVAESFNTEENLVELELYELEHSKNFGSHSLDKTEEVVQNNIDWMKTYFDVISDWLADNGFAYFYNVKVIS